MTERERRDGQQNTYGHEVEGRRAERLGVESYGRDGQQENREYRVGKGWERR